MEAEELFTKKNYLKSNFSKEQGERFKKKSNLNLNVSKNEEKSTKAAA